MLFAHLKRILRLDRLRLRGLSGAFDEFTLAGLASATHFPTFTPHCGIPIDGTRSISEHSSGSTQTVRQGGCR